MNGQEAIQLLKIFRAASRTQGEPQYETQIPDGIYNLIKQP